MSIEKLTEIIKKELGGNQHHQLAYKISCTVNDFIEDRFEKNKSEIKQLVKCLTEIHNGLEEESGIEYLQGKIDKTLDNLKNEAVYNVNEIPEGAIQHRINDAKELWKTGKRLEPIKMVGYAMGLNLKDSRKWCEQEFD